MKFAKLYSGFIILITIFILSIWAPPTIAEEGLMISPGDKVRIEVVDLYPGSNPIERVIGIFVKIDENTMTLKHPDSGNQLDLSRQKIHGMEVFVEGKSAREGAVFGATVGLGVASLIGITTASDTDGTEVALTAAGITALLSLALVPLGAVMGSNFASGAHWEPIPESVVNWGLGIAPAGGKGIFVAVRF